MHKQSIQILESPNDAALKAVTEPLEERESVHT